MAEVLSQQQIDEMLSNLKSGNVDIQDMQDDGSGKKVREYDFRSPKRFTREQLKLLNSIYDNFSWLFCLQISSMLRVNCQMEIVAIEEQQYHEYNNALNDSVLVGIISLIKSANDEDKSIMVEISREISFSLIDRFLGGNGQGYKIDRDYTDIELKILEYFYKQTSGLMKNAWNNYVETNSELINLETNARLLQSISPDETVAIIILDVKINELSGKMSICIPADTLEAIYHQFKLRHTKAERKSGNVEDNSKKQYIMGALETSELSLTCNLDKTEISMRELLNLQVGDIIPLRTPISENPVTLEVEKTPWFKGEVGIRKKHYAVKISKVVKNNK